MTYTERYNAVFEFHKWAERLPEKDWFKISDVMAQVYKKYEGSVYFGLALRRIS